MHMVHYLRGSLTIIWPTLPEKNWAGGGSVTGLSATGLCSSKAIHG